MKRQKTIEMVPVIIAGKEVMVPQSLKVSDLRNAENIPVNRPLVLKRGSIKKVVKDSDEIAVKEKDYFYDLQDYDIGNEDERILLEISLLK